MKDLKINFSVKASESIHAFYLFFIIVGIQIGAGILGTPRHVFAESRQDAWLSIIIAYIAMVAVVAVMFIILHRYPKTDIFGIQVELFGQWFGKLLGIGYLIFFTLELFSVIFTYIEIVQIFLFPTFPTYLLAFLLLTLIGYAVLGGFRVLIGLVFLFTFLSSWVIFLAYDPISRMESAHFFPMFEASLVDLLKGARITSYTFLGLEILFLVLPFVSNREHAKRPVFLGLSFTAFFVLFTTVISIGYYSPNDFGRMDWPVLSLFKSVSFSFIERFDYLIIAEWMMVILPTAALLMWAILHGTERLFQVSQRKTFFVIAGLLLLVSIFVTADFQIQLATDVVAQIGFWIVYVYPIILLPIVLFKTRKNAKKEGSNDKKTQ